MTRPVTSTSVATRGAEALADPASPSQYERQQWSQRSCLKSCEICSPMRIYLTIAGSMLPFILRGLGLDPASAPRLSWPRSSTSRPRHLLHSCKYHHCGHTALRQLHGDKDVPSWNRRVAAPVKKMVPFRKGADGWSLSSHVAKCAFETWCVSDHPVCAFIRWLRQHFIQGAATPPLQGGEYL